MEGFCKECEHFEELVAGGLCAECESDVFENEYREPYDDYDHLYSVNEY